MKKFKLFKMLAVLIVLITSIPQVWGWSGIQLRSPEWTGTDSWDYTSDTWTYGGEGLKYWDVYHSGGDAYWRIHLNWFNHDAGPSTNNESQNVGEAGYKVSNQSTNAFKTTENAGILRICSNQTADNNSCDETPYVWVERPKVLFKYPWADGTNWAETDEDDVTDNNDGTYTYRSTYRGVDFFNAKPVNGAWKVDESTTTITGSPSNGDRCEFKWTASGYKYTGEQYENRGVFEIIKLWTVTYYANGSTSGSAPGSQEIRHHTSETLATNSGSLAKTNYHFNGWNTKADGTGKHFEAGGSIDTTTNVTLYAEWVDEWAIQGSGDEMGDWSGYKYLPVTSTANTFEGTIELAENTTYRFKIRNRNSGELWGYGEADYQLAFVGQSDAYDWDIEPTEGKKDLVLMTAKSDTYTFTWNSSTKRLTVSFPDQSHPNTNNIYFKNSGESPYTTVAAHIWGGTIGGTTGWNRLPTLPSCEFDDETYYYAAIGDNTSCKFADGSNTSTQTGDLSSINSNKGQYYDLASGTWKDFTATLTLTHHIATNSPTPASIEVTYNSDNNLTGDVLTKDPTNANYSFQGYYTADGGGGDLLINTSGAVQNVTGYTSSGKWIRKSSAEVFAKWTQNITLDQNGADKNGTTSLAATYNAVLSTSGITETPKKIGKKFVGWATAASAGSLVINADGTVNTVASWTDKDKKWIHNGASELFAQWEDDNNEFTNATGDGDWTNPSNWSASVVPTNSYAAVQLSGELKVSSYIHVGSMDLTASGAKLTIQAGGTLEVAGTISNEDASKLVINSTGSSQGALIFNSTGSTAANVNMTMNATSGKFQFIAIPVSLVSVNPTFAGTGKYTYVWSNKDHSWERRGYYDDIYSFEAVLLKGQGYASFSGNLVSTGDKEYSGTYTADGYGYVYMYGNSWTAPIKMSSVVVSNASIEIMNGSTNSWEGVISTDVIPALQAFGVAVNDGGGSITINYDRDVRNPSKPNAPLKAPQRQTSEVQEPITVYVSGNEMQTRIRLFEDETRFSDEFDNGWEALYMEGQGYAGEMYAVGPKTKMNVLATNNLEGTVVGFVPGQATDYTISFTGDGKGYYFNDIATGESTLIDEANTYNFKSDENTNATRFVVSKMPLMPTGVDEVADGSKARKQMIDGTLYIIRDGRIYKVDGALVK